MAASSVEASSPSQKWICCSTLVTSSSSSSSAVVADIVNQIFWVKSGYAAPLWWHYELFSQSLSSSSSISNHCQWTSSSYHHQYHRHWHSFSRAALKKLVFFRNISWVRGGTGGSVFLRFMWNLGGHCFWPWKLNFRKTAVHVIMDCLVSHYHPLSQYHPW